MTDEYTNLMGELHTFDCPTLDAYLAARSDENATPEWEAWLERRAERLKLERGRRLIRQLGES